MPSEKYGSPSFVRLPSSDRAPIRTWSRRMPSTLLRAQKPPLKRAVRKALRRALAGPQ